MKVKASCRFESCALRSEDQLPIGRSCAHRQIIEVLERVAPHNAEVLITGPTGVGKEVYARFLHNLSRRASRLFVAVNCGAIPAELFENELFGHATGAYTGASIAGDGMVAAADQGTLFLDEVDALPASCQVKLLRFLQFREYRRLGETKVRRVDVRVVAASNSQLPDQVKAGRFREDLYFRLRVVPIEVPPLHERRQDLDLLLEAFIKAFSGQYSLPPVTFESGALEALRSHRWPGNVRELENCVRYLTCLQLARPARESDLPFRTQSREPPAFREELFDKPFREAKRSLVTNFEKEYLQRALAASDGNLSEAARSSGKARRAFFELMRKHSLQRLGEFAREASGAARPNQAKSRLNGRLAAGAETGIAQSPGT
jgi:two-component system, NtrC family, response regulator GlrR